MEMSQLCVRADRWKTPGGTGNIQEIVCAYENCFKNFFKVGTYPNILVLQHSA